MIKSVRARHHGSVFGCDVLRVRGYCPCRKVNLTPFRRGIETVKYNSFGQISHALCHLGGEYWRNM